MTATDAGDAKRDGSEAQAALARTYRRGATESPPPSVDARIRAQARAAIHGAGVRRWAIPIAIAATLALSVGVALEVFRGDGFQEQDIGLRAKAPPPATRKLEEAPAATSNRAATSSSTAGVRGGAESAGAPVPAQAAAERSAVPLKKEKRADRQEAAAAALGRVKAAAADITAVRVSGSPGAYFFSVTVSSPDTGCKRYADWWEVIDPQARLLYRRVLLHSHAGEQPFERSGGPVSIQPDTVVWVRAHMNTSGYGGVAFKGSVETGFASASLPVDFAAELSKQPPLPDGCAF